MLLESETEEAKGFVVIIFIIDGIFNWENPGTLSWLRLCLKCTLVCTARCLNETFFKQNLFNL